jgi:hypothetical protein
LLVSLVEALPDIIVAIVAALPEIITGIITALVGMHAQLAQAGVQLLVALIALLPDIIVRIVAAVPKIVTGLVDGFKNGVGRMSDVGKMLLDGLWQGIQNMRQWLIDRLRSLGNVVKDALKSVLGIHSPSTVFRDEIGKNLALGLGEGFETAMQKVTREMENAVPTDFNLDANLNANISKKAAGGFVTGGFGGISLTLNIENFNNNTGQDLRQLADELSILLADGIRRRGAATA